MNRLQNIHTQSKEVSLPANAPAGMQSFPVELNTEYSDVKGIVLHQIGAHTKYRIGIRNKDGQYYHQPALFKHYEQLGDQRYMTTDFPVEDKKIYIVVNVLESLAQAIDFEVVFKLER